MIEGRTKLKHLTDGCWMSVSKVKLNGELRLPYFCSLAMCQQGNFMADDFEEKKMSKDYVSDEEQYTYVFACLNHVLNRFGEMVCPRIYNNL